MILESVQERVLGAVRFLDATTLLKVSDGLRVTPDSGSVLANRSGLYVIWSAPGNGPLGITVTDSVSRYLQRRFTVPLPRDPDPNNASQSTSIFQAVEVRLYPAPTAVVSSGWALIRATVKKVGTDQVLGGALILVVQAGDVNTAAPAASPSGLVLNADGTVTLTTAAAASFTAGQFLTVSGATNAAYNGVYQVLIVTSTTVYVLGKRDSTPVPRGTAGSGGGTVSQLLARGMSDARGEALVAVPGIPITTFDGGTGGPVISTSVAVTIQTVFDPNLMGVPDPDDLEARKDTLPSSSVSAQLASGQVLITGLTVALA